MEVACLLMAVDWIFNITAIVDNPNCIPLGLSTINHESLELYRTDTMPSHDVVEILLKNDLCIFALRLEITTYNSYNTLICRIAYMISQGGPIGNILNDNDGI